MGSWSTLSTTCGRVSWTGWSADGLTGVTGKGLTYEYDQAGSRGA